jgi:DNA helicase-2/ATP-dependent DNA helicase PcrA
MSSSDPRPPQHGLNDTQQKAVQHRGSGLLVLAGAGTGKTRVITHRIADLVANGVSPREILAVTFTNKASREMKERLEKMRVPTARDLGPWIGTFHATGLRILKLHGDELGYAKGFSIYDDDAQTSIVKALLADTPGGDRVTPSLVHSYISKAKDAGIAHNELSESEIPEKLRDLVGNVYRRYDEELKRSNAMDYADLLLNTVKLLRRGPDAPAGWLLRKFRQVLVDEFQDTNKMQMEMVDLLSSNGETCVVGDDDQAIYGWRGADPGGMMRFSRRPGVMVVKLEDNYRSTAAILQCANAVIARNPSRLGKTLRSFKGHGAQVNLALVADERAEAEHVASRIVVGRWGDHAVLYRTHAQSRPIEEALRRRAIPYTIVGGLRFYDRFEIKDLMSYFRLAMNPRSDVDLIRIANRPARGVGTKKLGMLKTAAAKAQCPMYDVLDETNDPKLLHLREIVNALVDAREMPLPEFYAKVLKATFYREALADTVRLSTSTAQREQAQDRLANVDELANDLSSFAQDHPGAKLEDYLDHVALVSSFDKESGPAVSLMSIHAAKGLEFPRVFLVGFEEGLLPHVNSLETFEVTRDPKPIEEERRLAYVAITRAMDHLDILVAQHRQRQGRYEVVVPSRFARDLPREHVLTSKGL